MSRVFSATAEKRLAAGYMHKGLLNLTQGDNMNYMKTAGTMLFAVSLFALQACGTRHASQTSAQSSGEGAAMGGMQRQELQAPRAYTEVGADAYIANIATGKDKLNDVDAAWLVRQPEFRNWIVKQPSLGSRIAEYPYASAYVFNQDYFSQWANQNPDQGQKVSEAAMQWQKMDDEDKNAYYRDNPAIPVMHMQVRQGSSQGGAQGGGMAPGSDEKKSKKQTKEKKTGTGGAEGGTQNSECK